MPLPVILPSLALDLLRVCARRTEGRDLRAVLAAQHHLVGIARLVQVVAVREIESRSPLGSSVARQRQHPPSRSTGNSSGQPPPGIAGTGPSAGPPDSNSVPSSYWYWAEPGVGVGVGVGEGAGLGEPPPSSSQAIRSESASRPFGSEGSASSSACASS